MTPSLESGGGRGVGQKLTSDDMMSCDLESVKFIKSLKVGKVAFDFVIAFLRPKNDPQCSFSS